MEIIISKDNKTIKHIHSLRMKKYRNKYNQYIAEGNRAVLDLLESGHLEILCIKESYGDENSIQDLLDKCALKNVRHFLVRDAIFDSLETTVHGQGIIGIAKKETYDFSKFSFTDNLYLLLDRVQDPGNLGTIIRTAVAAGVKSIILTKGSVDPYNDKTIRSTMSAINEIEIYESVDVKDIIPLLKDSRINSYVTTLENAKGYGQVTYQMPAILVMGNEANGVCQELKDACNYRITIPIYGNIESLNLSVATAICLYKIKEAC